MITALLLVVGVRSLHKFMTISDLCAVYIHYRASIVIREKFVQSKKVAYWYLIADVSQTP